MDDLIELVLAGDRRAIARAITRVEEGGQPAHVLLSRLHRALGRSRRLGITGPPGSGKSTLVAALGALYRRESERVGIVAVDPTSPFSGGALLGDRVRMSKLATDPGIFIRSMASRGAFGGLARATWDAVDVLDAAGCDPVLVETVGVGQTEVEIAGLADTTLVVLSPEAGDSVQAMKAGLMEIADVFVVNKADREGAEALARTIQGMLDVRPQPAEGVWRPPVILVVAQQGDGVPEVAAEIAGHGNFMRSRGILEKRRREAVRRRILEIVDCEMRSRFWSDRRQAVLRAEIDRILLRETDPIAAAARVLADDGAASPEAAGKTRPG